MYIIRLALHIKWDHFIILIVSCTSNHPSNLSIIFVGMVPLLTFKQVTIDTVPINKLYNIQVARAIVMFVHETIRIRNSDISICVCLGNV